jgi:hypothetical protein
VVAKVQLQEDEKANRFNEENVYFFFQEENSSRAT